MSSEPHPDLELPDYPQFQHRFMVVQRVGWVLVGLIFIAGLVGLLGGSGVLATTTTGDSSGPFCVEHQMTARKRSPGQMKVHISPDAVSSTQFDIQINRSFIDAHSVDSINPDPAEVQASNENLTYTFNLAEPGEQTTVTFNIEAVRTGSRNGIVQLDDEQPIEFDLFVYP